MHAPTRSGSGNATACARVCVINNVCAHARARARLHVCVRAYAKSCNSPVVATQQGYAECRCKTLYPLGTLASLTGARAQPQAWLVLVSQQPSSLGCRDTSTSLCALGRGIPMSHPLNSLRSALFALCVLQVPWTGTLHKLA